VGSHYGIPAGIATAIILRGSGAASIDRRLSGA
jgi:hypothetical protein